LDERLAEFVNGNLLTYPLMVVDRRDLGTLALFTLVGPFIGMFLIFTLKQGLLAGLLAPALLFVVAASSPSLGFAIFFVL